MEPKKFWVRNYKSLRDASIEFPTKLTIVVGPSGSGKTALVEAFEALRNVHSHGMADAAVGVEVWHEKCRIVYELSGDKKITITDCNADEADKAIQMFLNNIVVIKDVNWKAVRSPQPITKETTVLLPDASNVVPFLFTMTKGVIPESLVETLRYVFPIKEMWFDDSGGVLTLKLVTENGVVLTQATAPSGLLKTLIIEAALMMQPTMMVIDEFENSLDPEAQQFLIDELRSYDIYAVLNTHSEVVLDYVKTPKEVVMLRLVGGSTVARRLGDETEETLKKRELTLSELIGSGFLEPLVF